MKMNKHGEPLVVGCNYHTTWQSHRAMRFVLVEVKENMAKLETRRTHKSFWTKTDDLIFIKTDYNKRKKNNIAKQNRNY